MADEKAYVACPDCGKTPHQIVGFSYGRLRAYCNDCNRDWAVIERGPLREDDVYVD